MASVGILKFLFLGMISGLRDVFNQSPFKSLILPRHKLLFLGTSFYIIYLNNTLLSKMYKLFFPFLQNNLVFNSLIEC